MRVPALFLLLTLTCCREKASAPPPTASTSALAAASPSSPRPATYDTSCKNDWECTPAPSCCVEPCSGNVINTRELARARADLECAPSAECPSAGGCQTFMYLCVEHTCKIAFEGQPSYRKREIQP